MFDIRCSLTVSTGGVASVKSILSILAINFLASDPAQSAQTQIVSALSRRMMTLHDQILGDAARLGERQGCLAIDLRR